MEAKISKTAVIHENVTIEEGVVIHDFVVVYPHTVIRKNAEIYDHCVLGKPPTSPGSVSRTFKEAYAPLIVGENTILCPGVVLYTGSSIGKNNLLGDFCSIREECTIGDYCIISRNVTINYNTIVGNHVKIMDSTHITGNAVIEDHVFISILVSTTNDNSMGREAFSEDHIKGPHIKKYATIAAGANILPGIVIGENALVGAGTIVTKDVPEHKVVLGNPAKVVRDV